MTKKALTPKPAKATRTRAHDAPAPTPPPRSTPAPRERRQRVQAAATGMAVLKGLARLGGRATLTALAMHVDESPAKVHRYLASLIEEGFVSQDRGTQQYCLGTEALLIGVAAMRQAEPIRAAEPALVRLREALELTCFVAVMGNRGPTILRIEEPGLPVIVNVRAGSVLSLLGSATGRLFLGLLDDSTIDAMAQAELATAPDELRAQLDTRDPIGALRRTVRAAGCTAVRDTNLKGISALSAPLRDYTGHVCAALTVLGATGAFDASLDGEAAAALRREADATSAVLGYRPAT
ncbi:IclR family transcriptional regulator [Burkholderia mayonis]|uniref:IclR family transcriptional regulator n=1 Tax=Burkholderia mayonis TaxID=1385591 RepID=UPI0009E750C1|nr:helix-turn-helix domain-containing protein [Burkholderia mayonis]